jgi:hypothetical protein
MYFSGAGLEEISQRHNVMIGRLKEWEVEYNWSGKKAALMESPIGIGVMLREKLRQQVHCQTQGQELTVEQVGKITKLMKCIKEIEGCGGDVLAAAIEVLSDFSRFIRERTQDREVYAQVSSWVQEYLRSKTDV